VGDPDEKRAAVLAVVDHMAPGGYADAHPPAPSELRATSVVCFPIVEASAKVRTGRPIEESEDRALAIWAGELPWNNGPCHPPRPRECPPIWTRRATSPATTRFGSGRRRPGFPGCPPTDRRPAARTGLAGPGRRRERPSGAMRLQFVTVCPQCRFDYEAVGAATAPGALAAEAFTGLVEAHWRRRLVYNWPEPQELDVLWLTAHTIHEVRHHLSDFDAVAAGGAPGET
jgi:hypothetical protein